MCIFSSLLSSSPCGTIEKTKSAAMISAPKSFIKSTSLASQGSLLSLTFYELFLCFCILFNRFLKRGVSFVIAKEFMMEHL